MKASVILSILSVLGTHALPVKDDVLVNSTPKVCKFDRFDVMKSTIKARSLPSTQPPSCNPPYNLALPLNQVWDHQMATYDHALNYWNYGYDQVMQGRGKINYCVRWESSRKVSEEQRNAIEATVRRSYNQWITELAGYEGFPYDSVDVNVVGWAVRNPDLLEGDTSNIQVYTTKDKDGVPECDQRCGRLFHTDDDYSQCPSGADGHYDSSLWLSEGFEGGLGGPFGQKVGVDYFLQNINAENVHIFLHEIGHTFGLDDFYDWTPTGVTNFLMRAGSAYEITEFDAWMARDWWRHIKYRYHI